MVHQKPSSTKAANLSLSMEAVSFSPIQSSESARVKLSKGAREWVGEVSLAYELSPRVPKYRIRVRRLGL